MPRILKADLIAEITALREQNNRLTLQLTEAQMDFRNSSQLYKAERDRAAEASAIAERITRHLIP